MGFILLMLAGIIANAGNFAVAMGSAYPPFAPALARKTNKEHPDLIAQVTDLINQVYRGVIDLPRFYDMMEQAGYSENIAKEIYLGAQTLLTGFDYVTLWRRGELDDSTLKNKLHSVGYSLEAQEELKKVTLYYPTPQDLVRMAVREVYTPEVVSKFGLNEDLPTEFIEAGYKAGLSEEFSKQYWASHWELPSAGQGFEMFQRDIIEEDDLTLLLKSLDVMPYWRDKMKQLQYNVITRVDIRRLYKTGVYNEDQVYDAYRHMGYSPEDSSDLLRFTMAEYSPIDEDVQNVSGLVRLPNGDLVPSRTMVINAYKKGIYDYTTALAGLETIGYPLDSARLLLQFEDDKLAQEIIDIKADAITDAYRNGDFDETVYRNQLTLLGVNSRYIETVMARELAQAKARTRRPTKTDIEQWLKKGVIDGDVYLIKMKGLGYSDNDIELYYQEMLIDMQK